MDYDTDKLYEAKMFIDYLTNGVDPITNTDVNEETLRNKRVLSCFRYLSDILANEIDKAEKGSKKSSDFYITDEQIAELRPFSYNCKVSELAVEINRAAAENETKKLSAVWINDWLETEGYLCKSDLNSRISTEKGKQLGITSEYRKRSDGSEYYINYHSEQAQRFIFSHLNEIIACKNKIKHHSRGALNIQYKDFPSGVLVCDFIKENREKCFILSVGSCDPFAESGGYKSLLLYKEKSKLLIKTDIPTNSANRCILSGILDAAAAIRSSTDVIILSSASLGFNTPKSANYALCQEIYTILSEKECSVCVCVCQGKGDELTSFINSFEL